jgi:hypothetical protein
MMAHPDFPVAGTFHSAEYCPLYSHDSSQPVAALGQAQTVGIQHIVVDGGPGQ